MMMILFDHALSSVRCVFQPVIFDTANIKPRLFTHPTEQERTLNFQGLQAKYRRLFQESTAWKLLRADNAPIILAFIADLFSDESEVPFGRARVSLDAELERCREL